MRRTVDYRAGALLGFVPQGDGIVPDASVAAPAPVPAVMMAYTNTGGSSGYQYNAPVQAATHDEAHHDAHHEDHEGWGDASYSFSYQGVRLILNFQGEFTSST